MIADSKPFKLPPSPSEEGWLDNRCITMEHLAGSSEAGYLSAIPSSWALLANYLWPALNPLQSPDVAGHQKIRAFASIAAFATDQYKPSNH